MKVKVNPSHKSSILKRYRLASFRKKRYKVVADKIKELRSLVRKCASKKALLSLERQLLSIAYFDNPKHSFELKKYLKFLTETSGADVVDLLDHLVAEFEVMCLNNGSLYALKIFKELYNIASRYAVGHSFEPIPFIKSRRNGVPYILVPFLPYLEGERQERQTALGVLQAIKLVELHSATYSLGAIENIPLNHTPAFTAAPVKIGTYFSEAFAEVKSELPKDFSINKWLRSYRVTLNKMFPLEYQHERLRSIQNKSRLHFSGRNGPNGPCLGTVVVDYRALTESPDLLEHIEALASMTNNLELEVILNDFKSADLHLHSTVGKQPIHSKINLKRESWGRLRPFATVDWFSHSALRGYHNWLYSQLENYPEDCTFDQVKGFKGAKDWTAGFVETESADLSEATNSIPLLVQREIVEQIAGHEFAYRWANIISNRTFKGPSGEDIKYLTGQPMGASSSWPMLAMWHHVIMRSCIHYCGLRHIRADEQCYYVIGDDVVMKFEELFRIYEIVVGTLQRVGISLKKGFHKKTDLGINNLPGDDMKVVGEFAKRIFINGLDITPLPPDELIEFIHSPAMLPNVVSHLYERDYILTASLVHDLAASSFDKQLALDCLFTPYGAGPCGNQQLEWEFLRRGSIWDTDQNSTILIYAQLLSELSEMANKTLLSVGDILTKWVERCDSDEEIKVKSWCIQCAVQSKVFYLTMEAMQSNYDRCMEDYFDLRPEPTPENWRELKKQIGNLQVIYDVNEIFKDRLRPKSDKYHFTLSYFGKAIKAYRRNFGELSTVL